MDNKNKIKVEHLKLMRTISNKLLAKLLQKLNLL
jgi:hypothetical protein